VSTKQWRHNGGVEVYLHTFLTSELDVGKWSASCPDCFTPKEIAPVTHGTGGWVGPSASLDTVVMRSLKYSAYSTPWYITFSFRNSKIMMSENTWTVTKTVPCYYQYTLPPILLCFLFT